MTNARHNTHLRLCSDARAIYCDAVAAVQANHVLDGVLLPEGRCIVVGAGKAAMAMAGVLEMCFPDRITHGQVVVPYGYRATLPDGVPRPRRIRVVEAGHPVPDAMGQQAAAHALAVAQDCTEGDLLVVLLSGGASALWPAPVSPLTLRDLREVNRTLLKSGADIHQINQIRTGLSRIKGGQLAAAAWPARTHTLVISDVPGDDLAAIGSGPTVGRRFVRSKVHAVGRELGLSERWLTVLGSRTPLPQPGDPIFSRSSVNLVGSNSVAIQAAAATAAARGYEVNRVYHDVEGEASQVGQELASEASRLPPGSALIWGGETTVTVRGGGRGGRNQELALAAACILDGYMGELVVLAAGTDGIDGPTDAAGAWATPCTAARARAKGVDCACALKDNDAYRVFESTGQLLRTGPTHTNVMDIGVALSAP